MQLTKLYTQQVIRTLLCESGEKVPFLSTWNSPLCCLLAIITRKRCLQKNILTIEKSIVLTVFYAG